MQTSVILPNERVPVADLRRALSGRAALVLAATAFVALCSRFTVPLWFTPVPLSLQNLGVLLVGLSLGPVDGFVAMVLYLLEGASGLPVFSPQGPGGVAQLLGPTGGFLMAYPLVAAVAGVLPRMRMFRARQFAGAALGGIAATFVLLAMGTGWLGWELHLGAAAAFTMGVAPFLPGEIVKVAAASGIYSSLSRLHQLSR